MSADGYFRVPRQLMTAPISADRKLALVWLISQASYAEREWCGATLSVGETRPVSLTLLETEFRWTRKAARVFMEYVLSGRCAEETGVRVKPGRKMQGHPVGHTQGHSEGHSKGHTYHIGLVRFSNDEGHSQGHPVGHTQGHSEGHHSVNGKETEQNTEINSPLRGESREGVASRDATAKRKRGVPTLLPENWSPSAANLADCLEAGIDAVALAENFHFYWSKVKGKKINWELTFTKRIAAVRGTGQFRIGTTNGNGKRRDGEDWRVRREGDGRGVEDDPAFNFPLPPEF